MRKRPEAKYERWWLGKKCRTSDRSEFKVVTRIEFTGPPSGVYGDVELHYADGTCEWVQAFGHCPRKKDVEVES